MEHSKIPLNKWLMAMHLMGASKKGMSAHQLHRTLGITYQSAWFLCHRIREAMGDDEPNKNGGPLGGNGKVVEADETVVGGKAKNRAYRDPAPKKMVATLVERGGRVRSKHVANIYLRRSPVRHENVSRKSTLNTDEASYYVRWAAIRRASWSIIARRVCLQVRRIYRAANSAEGYFSIFKRGVYGVFHSISEAHLHRYLKEFDFRYNNRSELGLRTRRGWRRYQRNGRQAVDLPGR